MRDIHLCHTINCLGWTIIFLGGGGGRLGYFQKLYSLHWKTKSGKWGHGIRKKIKQVLYTLQVLCLTFCQFSPKKAQPKDEKIITPFPPSKNNGISLSTQRWCLYEGSPTLRGGEHRNKFRYLKKGGEIGKTCSWGLVANKCVRIFLVHNWDTRNMQRWQVSCDWEDYYYSKSPVSITPLVARCNVNFLPSSWFRIVTFSFRSCKLLCFFRRRVYGF